MGEGGVRPCNATPQQHPIAPPAHYAQHPELRLILRDLYPHPWPKAPVGALSKAERLGWGVKKVKVRVVCSHHSTIPNNNRARRRPTTRFTRSLDRSTRTCANIPGPRCRLRGSPPSCACRGGAERAW